MRIGLVLVLCSSTAAIAGDEDLEPRLEHAEVRAEGIEVRVAWWTLTGNTHVADELAITTRRGTLRLKTAGEEGGETLPLIDQIYKAGKSRWVVLGWSSYGEGMQTEHAWLIDATSQPRIVDKLEWTTDRRHAGLAIDLAPLRIGIPLPRAPADDDKLHDELDWQLVHAKRSLTLDQVAKLPATETHIMAVRAYTPPFHRSASEAEWSGRFVWFDAGKRFQRR